MNTLPSYLVLIAALIFSGCSSTPPAVGPRYSEAHIDFKKWNRDSQCCQATGNEIAIASGGTLSAKAGLAMRQAGGNIVDSAVATSFVLAVERPQSLGLGGGGFLTLHLAGKNGGDYFIDFRETAPAKATRDMFLDKDQKVVPALSTRGALAVGTPGFVAGMAYLHKKWGKLPWKKVIEPAIAAARDGFTVYPSLAEKLASSTESLAKDAYLKSIFLTPQGAPYKTGEKLVQADLAKTLEIIALKGPSAFYTGEIGKKMVTFLKEKKGILSTADLKNYRVVSRKPIVGKYRDYTYVTAPPPSAGGVMIAEILNILAPYDLNQEAQAPLAYAHLLGEAMKRGYADRSEYIGDPDFVKTGYEFLLDPKYADEVRKLIDRNKAVPSSEIHPGKKPVTSKSGTTQLSLIDKEGNAVSATLTINTGMGAFIAIPGTGIVMNNEMDDFSVKPGEKNAYGLTGGTANAIAPGKRPVSSMVPTIILKDGQPILAVGAKGGSRIISSTLQVILNSLAVYPNDLRRSVFAPRYHHQWLPDQLDYESGLDDKDREKLKAMGHQTGIGAWYAEVQAVQAKDGKLTAVFDARDEGGAAAQ